MLSAFGNAITGGGVPRNVQPIVIVPPRVAYNSLANLTGAALDCNYEGGYGLLDSFVSNARQYIPGFDGRSLNNIVARHGQNPNFMLTGIVPEQSLSLSNEMIQMLRRAEVADGYGQSVSIGTHAC